MRARYVIFIIKKRLHIFEIENWFQKRNPIIDTIDVNDNSQI